METTEEIAWHNTVEVQKYLLHFGQFGEKKYCFYFLKKKSEIDLICIQVVRSTFYIVFPYNICHLIN